MAETTVLRSNAIQRNATVGAPQHGPVKTGDLPLVQVKMVPGGPQVQSQPQRTVEILPPRDEAAAVRTGGLPMVNVKMTQNGPQPDDGRDRPVVIKENRHGGVAAGSLPVVQVKMTQAGPQVQNLPNVQSAPPQLQSAPVALSQPRAQGTGFMANPPRVVHATAPAMSQPRVARVAAPQAALPPVPELTLDQLMFLRHVADKCLGEMQASTETIIESAEGVESAEGASAEAVLSDNVKLAKSAIDTLDQMMVAVAIHAEATAKAAAAAAASPPPAATAAFAPATGPSIVPAAPSASYVAGRVGARPNMVGSRVQRNAAMAPRRVSRGGSPLPPVIVKMEGERAVVQNKAEIDQVRAEAKAAAAAAAAAEATSLDQISTLAAENEALRRQLEQARAASPVIETTATPTDGNPQG